MGERQSIWIDAICIDQTNQRERNLQVNLMGEIYHRARAVVVWLGDAEEHKMVLRDWMEKLTALGNGHRRMLNVRH